MRQCDVCGADFEAVRSWQKRCSAKCNSVASNTKKRSDPRRKHCRTCRLDLPASDFDPAHRSCRSCEAISSGGQKRCNRCDAVKNKSAFYKRSQRRDGLDSTCKACRSRQFKVRNATPDAKLKAREYKYRAKYGIGVADVDAMLAQQQGLCAICKVDVRGITFHVDHNHETGAVRSILCLKCNSLLGYAAEDPAILRSAIAYLERHSDVQTLGP